jgi:hypothetical protein
VPRAWLQRYHQPEIALARIATAKAAARLFLSHVLHIVEGKATDAGALALKVVKEYTVFYQKTNAGVVVLLKIKDEFLQVRSLLALSSFLLTAVALLHQNFPNIDSDNITLVQPICDNPIYKMFGEYSDAGQTA